MTSVKQLSKQSTTELCCVMLQPTKMSNATHRHIVNVYQQNPATDGESISTSTQHTAAGHCRQPVAQQPTAHTVIPLHWQISTGLGSRKYSTSHIVHIRVVVSVSMSRSRDVPTSRLGLVLRKIVNVSVSSRPFTSRAQDQFSAKLCRPQYSV